MNKFTTLSISMILSLALCAVASAQTKGAIKAKEEIIIHEVCDKIWPRVKNFGEPHTWHPAIVSTESQGGNAPGATRVLTLGTGDKVYEELTRYSNKAQSLSFVITSVNPAVVPVKNFASRFRLEKEGSRCEVDWQATFDNASGGGMSDEEVKNAIAGFFRAGLENIAKMMMMK